MASLGEHAMVALQHRCVPPLYRGLVLGAVDLKLRRSRGGVELQLPEEEELDGQLQASTERDESALAVKKRMGSLGRV